MTDVASNPSRYNKYSFLKEEDKLYCLSYPLVNCYLELLRFFHFSSSALWRFHDRLAEWRSWRRCEESAWVRVIVN